MAPRTTRAAATERELLMVALIDDLAREGYVAVPECRFDPERKSRFDLAIPASKLALEIQGVGVSAVHGAHQRIGGMRVDHEKNFRAVKMGWRVIYCLWDDVRDGTVLAWLREVLRERG